MKDFIKTGKSVLLFSGGMDSVIHAELLNPDILLRISMNETYERMEEQQAKKVVYTMAWEEKYKEIKDVFNFKSMELSNLIIPNRNAYLILKASEYGEKIYLSSIEGDGVFDKSEKFFQLMKDVLDHVWQEYNWTEQRTFEVLAPFKRVTKTELLSAFLNKVRNEGNPGEDAFVPILTSYSCFTGNEQPCGVCKPCTRKAVALINNGYNFYESNYFSGDPLEVLEKIKSKLPHDYREREGYDTLMAYGKMKKLSPKH